LAYEVPAAIKTLEALGYIYEEGEQWTAPPAAQPAPVQEPVADVYMAGNMKTNIGTNGRVVYVSTVYSEKPLVKGDKLYTTPFTQPAPVREDWGPGPHEYHSLPPAQPAVPDALNPKDENPAYAAGWNDCRAEMLKGMKP
jgi:hypothetical protein